MGFTYTSTNEEEIERIKNRLREEGVRCKVVRTMPRTFRGEDGDEITVGTARPLNLTVANKHTRTLEMIIAEKK